MKAKDLLAMEYDIRTLADLDRYREKHRRPDGSIDSRYGTLKRLVGENAADAIMRNLEVAEWFTPRDKQD